MRTSRALGAAVLAVVAVFALTACIQLPFFNQNRSGASDAPDPVDPSTSDGSDLIGTTWTGTDSDGDFWSFDFQDDGTVGFTLIEDSYDDATDTWTVEDGTLTISIAFDSGLGSLAGPYAPGDTAIDLDGTQGDVTWTVTITPS